MLCVKVIAARIQRNLCDPRISVVFDPARSAGLVIYPVVFYGFNHHQHTHHCCSCKHVYSNFNSTVRVHARLYKHGG